MYIRDRKEREEYMDDLERQMGDQREQIQRTLDGMEGSSQRGGMLSRLRGSLPRFPRRERGRGYLEEASEETAEDPESSGFTPSIPSGPRRRP
jgi:hypothetical protein